MRKAKTQRLRAMQDVGAQVQAVAGQAVTKTKALGDELQGNLKVAGDKLKEAGTRLPALLKIPNFPERVPGEPGMFKMKDMAPIEMIKSGALRALARGCVKRTLDPTGRYEVHRYGQANQRMRLNTASVFGTSISQLMEDFKYPLAVTLYMRVLKHAVLVLLVLFACGLFGSYENFVRSGKRNECRGVHCPPPRSLGLFGACDNVPPDPVPVCLRRSAAQGRIRGADGRPGHGVWLHGLAHPRGRL